MEVTLGSRVWLRTDHLPIRLEKRKLAARYVGPFEVLEAVSASSFKVALPLIWKIHPVFHASQLKPCTQEELKLLDSAAPLDVNGQEEFEVESILGKRVVHG